MKVEVDPDDVQIVNADGRGRVYLGTEFADVKDIEVAVLDDPSTEDKSD